MAEKIIVPDDLSGIAQDVKENAADISTNTANITTNAEAITALQTATTYQWVTTTINTTVSAGGGGLITLGAAGDGVVPAGMVPISLLYAADSDPVCFSVIGQVMRTSAGIWRCRVSNPYGDALTLAGTCYILCVNSPIA